MRRNFNLILGLIFVAFIALNLLLPVQSVFADHPSSKSWVFHWADKDTVSMTETNGKGATFKRGAENNGRINFGGTVQYSVHECRENGTAINLVIDRSNYDKLDPKTPTKIDYGGYGAGDSKGSGNDTCDYADALVRYLRSGDANVGFTSTTKTDSFTDSKAQADPAVVEEEENCQNGDGELRWIMCPVIIATAGALNWVDSRIEELLSIDKGYYENQGIKDATANIRNIAYLILVPIMLVMVISTALGFEFISAYTMKRALPRLFAAVIFITISYPFCVFMIEFTNVLGNGVQGLLTAPFSQTFVNDAGETVSVDNLTLASLFGGSWASSVIGTFGVAFAALILFWLFGSALLMFAIAALGVLLLRQILIVALLLVAPLAILAWIFPGNDKLWKAWWGTFSKLLMMFPIIMGLIAIGHIFAFIIHENQDTSATVDTFRPFMILFAYMVPYALIMSVFKFAGGVLAMAAGKAEGFSQAGAKRRSEKRRQKVGKAWQGTKDGTLPFLGRAANTTRRGRLSKKLQRATLLHKGGASLNRTTRRNRVNSALSTRDDELQAKAAEHSAVKAVLINDDLLNAAAHGDQTEQSARNYLGRVMGQTGQELEQNVAAVTQARNAVGARNFNVLAAAANAGTSTGYGSGQVEMHEAIIRAAGGDKALETRMLGRARQYAERAKRVDLYGTSYSTSADILSRLHDGSIDRVEASQILEDEVVDAKSAGELGTSKARSLKILAPALQRRLAKSSVRVNTARADHKAGEIDDATLAAAEAEHDRILAANANLIDVAGQTSTENAEIIGKEVLEQKSQTDISEIKYEDVIEPVLDRDGNPAIDRNTNLALTKTVRKPVLNPDGSMMKIHVEGLTYTQEIESRRGNFGPYRREYGTGQTAAAAAAAAAGLPPPPPPPPPEGPAGPGATPPPIGP